MQQPTEPTPPAGARGRNPLATPAGAGALAVVLVALIAAVVLGPGMLAPDVPGSAARDTPEVPGTPATSARATPGSSSTPTASPLPSFVRPTPTPEPTFMSYVVGAGDSLNTIAHAFGTTARSLAWWNRGSYPSLDPESASYDPDHIEPGWVLVLIPGVRVDDANPPTPGPAPPAPVPSAGPSANPGSTGVAGGPATVVSHGPRGTTEVALTFDMGGRLDPALEIVGWLIDHEVHATLFPTGKSGTTTTEGSAALQLAASRPELFAFGNHSWDHSDFTTLAAAQMGDQLRSTEEAIQGLIGVSTAPWFRPPYGAWTAAVREGVGAAGWSTVVMWDVDTIDWKSTADGGPTAGDIVTRVVSRAQGGSIVLMHLGGWHTLEALPDLVAGLEDLGLTPVTLAEMLGP